MRRYTASEKLSIINEVLKDGKSVYAVCKAHKISKPSFYKWIAKYKVSKKNRLYGLRSRVRIGSRHPRSVGARKRLEVLRYAHRFPLHSCRKIAKALGIGHHAVQNILGKEGLARVQLRQQFSLRPFWKRESAQRRLGMMELLSSGWKVGDICGHFGISKPTFYKWRKRFDEAEGRDAGALADRFPAGNRHWRYIDEGKASYVLGAVKARPELSVHKIHAQLPKVAGKPIVGHHGIQNVLNRYCFYIF